MFGGSTRDKKFKNEFIENILRKLEKLGCHLGYLILK